MGSRVVRGGGGGARGGGGGGAPPPPPELALRVSDRWRGNAPLAYTGIRLARGGRWLVPWQFLDIRIDDPSAVASTVHVVAYPWRGEWSCSGSLAYGIDRASV